MNLRSLRPALTGLALLATAGVVGCGSSDKVPVLPRLDVASVIKGDSADDTVSNDLANEQLVNQQINVGHEVAAPTEPTEPGRPSLRDRLLPGRKKRETLADISTDPFLDDLDKMLVSGAQEAAGTVGAVEDAFNNTVEEAQRDAMAMFGPEPSPGTVESTEPTKPTRVDPFGNIDLVASQATSKTAGNELETTVFGDGLPVGDSEFDQFLQQAAKPLNRTSAGKPKDPFDPLNATDRVSLEPDRSEFEPFNSDPGETTTVQTDGPSGIDSEFEPDAATMDTGATTVVREVAEPVAPEFPDTPEPAEAAFKVPTAPAEVDVTDRDSATVMANAPAALPTPSRNTDPEVPAFTESEPASPQKRIELDPTLYEPPPVIDADPFEDGSEFAADSAPKFRTANRQVTLDVGDPETAPPVAPVSQTRTESTAPSSAVQPAPARALIPPGEWTAWFLIAGAITVALLLFAPGRGRS